MNGFYSFSSTMLSLFLIHYLPGSHNELFKNIAEKNTFPLEKEEEHQESLDLNNPRDFIDSFLIKMEEVQMTIQLHLCGCCDSWVSFDLSCEIGMLKVV